MSAGRVYSLSEVAQHTTEESAWFVISNHVYDVSKFLDEHPGGKEVLLDVVGRDATNSFEDVGHSSDAREMLKQYEIGQLDPSDCKKGGLASCFTSGTSSISEEKRPKNNARSLYQRLISSFARSFND